jgi:hypothetical protein
MRPLTLDDLIPLEEYVPERHEFFETLERYLDRYRRVRVGPNVTLVFENRQTLWFRVQEVLRVARLADPERVQRELDLYNTLLPTRDYLQAALLVETTDAKRWSEEMTPWRGLRGEDVRLRIGKEAIPGQLLTNRPEDLAVGSAHWLRFAIGPAARQRTAGARLSVCVEIQTSYYNHASAPLSADMRQSLVDDLLMSERDAQRAAS